MTIHPNGDLSFQVSEKIPTLSMYRTKQTTPLVVLEPRYPPCVAREFKGQKLPCQLLSLKWTCKVHKTAVNIKTCEGCDVSEERRNSASIN